MGNKLFGVDISGIINQNIGPGVLAATLTKYTSGTRTTGQLTGGTNPTSEAYSCRGFIDRQADRTSEGTLVDNGTVLILLVGDSISGGAISPSTEDHIAIEGTTYAIKVIDRDPAAATYECVSAEV